MVSTHIYSFKRKSKKYNTSTIYAIKKKMNSMTPSCIHPVLTVTIRGEIIFRVLLRPNSFSLFKTQYIKMTLNLVSVGNYDFNFGCAQVGT